MNRYPIPFHQSTCLGEEVASLTQAMGNGSWVTESVESKQFFQAYYPNSICLFTNSCSSALEIAVRALGIEAGDEVIIPGFGFVAVANAVINNGAKPVFADVILSNGNINVASVEDCISPRTKAVIAIHYAGNPFDVASLLQLCNRHNLYLIEDAAQGIGSQYHSNPLGSFGHLACLSFDYMKNITCGQGGLLIVNEQKLLQSVQTVYDNGTNRQALLAGTEKKFDWVSKGNNFRINPIASYFLPAQLKALEQITTHRLKKWDLYYQLLTPLFNAGKLNLPESENTHNAHIFYIITSSENERNDLREYLREKNIFAEHHYSFLPGSSFGKQFFSVKQSFQNSEKICTRLLRLPLWNNISTDEIKIVAASIMEFYPA